jgi:hypothetical protein
VFQKTIIRPELPNLDNLVDLSCSQSWGTIDPVNLLRCAPENHCKGSTKKMAIEKLTTN